MNLRRFLSNDAGALAQFVKYGAVGVMSTVVQTAAVYALAATILPCLGPDDLAVKALGLPAAHVSDAVRAVRLTLATGAGFVVANVFCWLMNRRFVFKPGRHVWYIEFLFFFGVSAVAMALAAAVQWALVKFWGVTTTAAILVEVVVSFLFNYALRKFFVFKG